MSSHPKIVKLIEAEDQMEKLLKIRLTEELERHDGISGRAPADFTFFDNTKSNDRVRKAYEIMQRQYVLRDCDRIEFDTAVASIKGIYKDLLKNKAWLHAKPPKIKKKDRDMER